MDQINELPEIKEWSILHKITFRFLFVFIILMTSIWELLPFLDKFFYQFHFSVSFWIQNNILHNRWALSHEPTGSGDTIDDWVLFLAWLAFASITTIIWSILDRKRKEYTGMENVLKIVVRMYLAIMMLSYGFSKIFAQQMIPPSLTQLYAPLGNLSPMRLSWVFIGYSAPYEIFTGVMEALGAVFLLIRRTTFIGAFLIACVMTNVAMMNFCYDIPVKLYSCFLLFLSIYLISFAGKRIFRLVLLHKRTEPEIMVPKKPWQKYSWAFFAVVIIFFYGFYPVYSRSEIYNKYRSQHPKFYGSYDVLEYSFLDSTYNSATSEDRWNQIVIGEGSETSGYSGFIRKGMHKVEYCFFSFSQEQGVSIHFRNNSQSNYFDIQHKDSVTMELVSNGPIITKMLVKKNDAFFPLAKSHFHWISPTSY